MCPFSLSEITKAGSLLRAPGLPVTSTSRGRSAVRARVARRRLVARVLPRRRVRHLGLRRTDALGGEAEPDRDAVATHARLVRAVPHDVARLADRLLDAFDRRARAEVAAEGAGDRRHARDELLGLEDAGDDAVHEIVLRVVLRRDDRVVDRQAERLPADRELELDERAALAVHEGAGVDVRARDVDLRIAAIRPVVDV